MLCHRIEDVITWGLHLSRRLFDLEAAFQRRDPGGGDVPEESDWKAFQRDDLMLAGASKRGLLLADECVQAGFAVTNLDEFRQIAEDAPC